MTDLVADMLTEISARRTKKKPTIMREFSIGEFSVVDRPAQVGALAVIMKRKNNDDKGENDMSDIYKSNLPSDPNELLKRGLDAVAVDDSGPSCLQKVAGWLKSRDVADNLGKDVIVKGLELSPPTVSETDRAIGELAKSIQMDDEDQYSAYSRAVGSKFGQELYGHRTEMDRAKDSATAYAAHRQTWRESQKRDRTWQGEYA